MRKVMIDLFGFVFTAGPVAAMWSGVLAAASWANARGVLGPSLPALPLLGIALLLAAIRAFRALLPKLEPGVYRVGLNRGSLSWYGHLALGRAAKVSGLRPLLHAFYVTRFFLYRALGADIAFGAHTSIEFVMADAALVRMGPGVTLGENVYIGCHYFLGDRLMLKRVDIGRDCFIGMNSVIGPGTTIGDGAWIGFGNAIAGARIEPGTRLPDRKMADYPKGVAGNR